ncbi:MAG: segregation/condensation protein A [Planctomycetes bacterium]|nr:segregation/condensation protein A [Planctomycetota bacterium]
MNFRVDLDIYRGPLDLLLYLVRKHEVAIVDLPIAPITAQFLQYLEVLQELNVDSVGDFVEMASTLIELKSRSVLPHEGEDEEPLEEPHQDLVRQLLEYKRYKDAASVLEERGRVWRDRFVRDAGAAGAPGPAKETQPIHEVELWDLVSAFGRIMKQHEPSRATSIVYDDTPIHVFMERIHERLVAQGHLALGDLFQPGMHKSTMVGIVLAVLELVRHHSVLAEQDALFGEVTLFPPTATEPAPPEAKQE